MKRKIIIKVLLGLIGLGLIAFLKPEHITDFAIAIGVFSLSGFALYKLLKPPDNISN